MRIEGNLHEVLEAIKAVLPKKSEAVVETLELALLYVRRDVTLTGFVISIGVPEEQKKKGPEKE